MDSAQYEHGFTRSASQPEPSPAPVNTKLSFVRQELVSEPPGARYDTELELLCRVAASAGAEGGSPAPLSFTAISIAFLFAEDAVSRWFQSFVKPPVTIPRRISIEAILQSKSVSAETRAEHLQRARAGMLPDVAPLFSTSARYMLDEAREFARKEAGRQDAEPRVGTRHLMAAYISRTPSDHRDQLRGWGFDQQDWSNEFLNFLKGFDPHSHWFSQTSTPHSVEERSRNSDALGSDAVPAWLDEPAAVDELGRRAFAKVLAARITEARGDIANPKILAGPFLVHIHGPWGSGKTTVLNLLSKTLRSSSPNWIVVGFNAWKQQRLRPPWWTLIRTLYTEGVTQLPRTRALKLRFLWVVWKIRADWFPVSVAATLIVLAGLFAWQAVPGVGAESREIPKSIASVTGSQPTAASVLKGQSEESTGIKTRLDVIVAILSAGAGLATLSRSLFFGSASAAQSYVEMRTDPLQRIVDLFERVVGEFDKPLAVFIDDLDRCEKSYVVELLEGIQTLFRGVPITFVVAADRKWICGSFESVNSDFSAEIGVPGRPLSYLFLEKGISGVYYASAVIL